MEKSILTADFSSNPYWWDAAPLREPVETALPDRVDVAVVGAGLTGLVAALRLARAGRQVLVLEAERAGEGASTRNAGFIGRAVTVPFSALVRRLGVDGAMAAHEEGVAAGRFVAELIAGERIQCHYRVAGRFTGAERPRHYDAMATELELTRRHVATDARMVPRPEQRAEIGTDHYHGGMLAPGTAEIHPGLYHQGLLERALAAGAIVAERTPVLGLSGAPGDLRVETARGPIAARDIVLATNAHTGGATPWFRRRLVPAPTYMLATEPLAPETMARLLPNRRTVLDTRNNMRELRASPDGTRILFGGRTGRGERTPEDTAARLHADMATLFPELGDARVSHCWKGAIGFTFDRLPHIGVREGVHYVLGYNGAGVPTGTLLGDKAACMILGEPGAGSAFAGRAFPTKPFYTGRPWFLPAVLGWYRLKDALRL
jgi:glycine/D-amino acid oxidase-like deaminating enzyme